MNKRQYITPELTVVTFKAERGYAESLGRSVVIAVFGGGTAPKGNQEGWLGEVNLFGDSQEENKWDI